MPPPLVETCPVVGTHSVRSDDIRRVDEEHTAKHQDRRATLLLPSLLQQPGMATTHHMETCTIDVDVDIDIDIDVMAAGFGCEWLHHPGLGLLSSRHRRVQVLPRGPSLTTGTLAATQCCVVMAPSCLSRLIWLTTNDITFTTTITSSFRAFTAALVSKASSQRTTTMVGATLCP